MKKRIIAFLVTLFCCAAGFAGNIQADDVSLKPGEMKGLILSLTSAVNDMVGVQFDVTLPNGFTMETKEGTVYQLSQNQLSDMACNINNLGNGTYRFMLYSNSLQKLRAGELMSLNLKAGSYMAVGNYTVLFHDVTFSDANGQVTNEDGTFATIKLTNFYPAATNVEMTDTKIISGETAPLTLKLLDSIRGCVGIQFDLSLPEGFSLEKDGSGKEYTISTNQASDVTCNLTVVSNGVYRFMIYSNSLKEFVPGELMNINLKVSEKKPLESYSVSIRDVQLSDISGNVHNDNGTSANVKVTKLFTLLYQVDGINYKSYNVEFETIITPEAEPTKEGYTFSGWSEIPATMPSKDVTITGTFVLAPVTIKADDQTRTYGEGNPAWSYTVTSGEVYGNGTPTMSCEATPKSPVGKYDITIEKGTVENPATLTKGTLTITKAPLTITAKSYSIKQGEPLPTTYEITYSGFKNGETKSVLSQQPSVICSATAASEPGRYDIIVSGATADNYEITYVKGTLRIRSLVAEPGDLNGDGEVDVTDVVELIDMVLAGIYDPAGDINGDGEVDVTDVVELIDMVLSGE